MILVFLKSWWKRGGGGEIKLQVLHPIVNKQMNILYSRIFKIKNNSIWLQEPWPMDEPNLRPKKSARKNQSGFSDLDPVQIRPCFPLKRQKFPTLPDKTVQITVSQEKQARVAYLLLRATTTNKKMRRLKARDPGMPQPQFLIRASLRPPFQNICQKWKSKKFFNVLRLLKFSNWTRATLRCR